MIQVTAAILVKDNKFLIAKRPAHDKLANKWEFPGGKIEDGETPEECLKRELYEEFKIRVKVGNYFYKSIYGEIELLAYYVEWIEGTMDLVVHDEIRWVAPGEFGRVDFAPADLVIVAALQECKKV